MVQADVEFYLTDEQRARMGAIVRRMNGAHDAGVPGIVLAQPDNDCLRMKVKFIPHDLATEIIDLFTKWKEKA